MTTIDGDKKNIDGEVFNNPFQLPATRNGGEDEGRCDVVVVAVMVMAVMLMMFNNPFQLPATRNGGEDLNDEGGCVVVVVVVVKVMILQMMSEFSFQA